MANVLFLILIFGGITYLLVRRRRAVVRRMSETPPVYREEKQPAIFSGHHISEVRSGVVQVLETLTIMVGSKNIDTILGRADFLRQRLQALQYASIENGYETAVQLGFDQYKSTYYNQDIHKWQAGIVLRPSHFDCERFIAESLYTGFMKHYHGQLEEIDSLKRESAIQNRYAKLLEEMEEFLSEFQIVWDTADANKFKLDKKAELQAIKRKIKSQIE